MEKNRTTKNSWVEEDLSKFPEEKKDRKKDDTIEKVEQSRLCKTGLLFLWRITVDPSPWENFTPWTKQSVERP